MDIFKGAERLLAMDDCTWRRHANPWSGITRFGTVLPLLVLAIWSRVWLGWWALIPIGLAAIWIWLNPRLFPEPERLDHWMSRAVLGERIFLEHRADIAAHHVTAGKLLSLLSIPGAILMIWGLVVLWWEAALFGTALAILPKAWFCDRMVWLHDGWVRQGQPIPGIGTT
ncbi:DUF6653 family protein [Parasulfitobacter algicola]